MKKYDPNVIKWDSQALLKEVALADVVGGWKDGILTIGTLGCYEPLKSFNDHKDYLALESDEVEEDEGDQEENYSADGYEYEEENKYYYSSEHDEEMNPLIHSSFEKQSFEDVVNDKSDDDNASKEEVFGTLNALPVVSYEVTESNHVVTDQKKKKGERITLADLFLADSEKIMKQKDSAKVLIDQPSEKPSLKAKHGLPTLAKKLIPRVNKDNARPLKNIQKVSQYYASHSHNLTSTNLINFSHAQLVLINLLMF